MKLPEVKSNPKVDYVRANDLERARVVRQDIAKIEEILGKDATDEELTDLHRYLDGKYQASIVDWGKSMYCFNDNLGFLYNRLSKDAIICNLKLMRAKLEAFQCGWNKEAQKVHSLGNSDVNVTVNNTNSVNLTVSFEEAKQKIDDMPGLTDSETEEIKSKIDELKDIDKEEIPKKKKWEKVKPILTFMLDKGADVAITIMSLIMQMKLGM